MIGIGEFQNLNDGEMLFNDINWLSKKGSRCKRTDLELWLNLLCSSTSPETRYVVQDDAPEDHSGPLP